MRIRPVKAVQGIGVGADHRKDTLEGVGDPGMDGGVLGADSLSLDGNRSLWTQAPVDSLVKFPGEKQRSGAAVKWVAEIEDDTVEPFGALFQVVTTVFDDQLEPGSSNLPSCH